MVISRIFARHKWAVVTVLLLLLSFSLWLMDPGLAIPAIHDWAHDKLATSVKEDEAIAANSDLPHVLETS